MFILTLSGNLTLQTKSQEQIYNGPDTKKIVQSKTDKSILQAVLRGKFIAIQAYLKKLETDFENQAGGVGRHTAPPRTTRTDRESNSKGTNTKKIENNHSSRLVGGAEKGTGVERTRVAVAECGTNGTGSPSTSRPCSPTFAQINQTNGGQRRRPLRNPGLQHGEIKPQTSD